VKTKRRKIQREKRKNKRREEKKQEREPYRTRTINKRRGEENR
jgi:hypothetical protein